jgi:Nif-specific regulatory protein
MARLVVREPGRVAVTVDLADGLTVGRQAGNDVVVADRQASRLHARFALSEAGVTVTDLGSMHGTFVNGARIEGERPLADKDVVQIGNVLLELRTAGPEDGLDLVTTMTPGPPTRADADARRLRLLYDVSRAIGSSADPEELLGSLLESTMRVLGCACGAIGFWGEAGEGAGRRIARGDITLDGNVVQNAVRTREAALLREGRAASAAPRRTALVAPLVSGERAVGFLWIEDRSAQPLGTGDLEFASALGQLLGAVVVAATGARRDAAVAEALRASHTAPDILGASAAMERFKAKLAKYAAAGDAPVLIRGESGTGKELAAQTLHALSPRAGEPFVAVNCAAIPDTLIESELFGHQKGAFTGASRARRGRFGLADRGTLFLDEIGDLSLAAQAKVLRAIETGEIQPLGAEETLTVDVRVVSATHKALDAEIAAGRFREDLYYRLSVGELVLPPLRERDDDAILLARAFLHRAAERMRRRGLRLSADAEAVLRAYPFPGNVRQLANEIERAVILAEGTEVELDDLEERLARAGTGLGAGAGAGGAARGAPPAPASSPASPAPFPATAGPRTLAQRWTQLDVDEQRLVEDAMAQSRGNLSEAARLLGVSRIVLKRRLLRYGVDGKVGTGSGD